MAKRHWVLLTLLIVNGSTKESMLEPREILQKAVNKLASTDDAGSLQAAVPDLVNILTASMSVDDLTTNGFGLAIIELSKSIIGES